MTPENSTPPAAPASEGPGLIEQAKQIGGAFIQGAGEGIANEFNMAVDIVKAVPKSVRAAKDNLLTNNIAAVANAISPESVSTQTSEDRESTTPDVMKYKTGVGSFAEKAFEFGQTYALSGGFFGRFRTAPIVGGVIGRGAMTNAALANSYEGNLSEVLTEVGGPFNNPFTRALATGKDDPILLRKFKASVEGMGLDAVVASLGPAVKAARKWKAAAASGDEAAAEAAKLAAQKADDGIRRAFSDRPEVQAPSLDDAAAKDAAAEIAIREGREADRIRSPETEYGVDAPESQVSSLDDAAAKTTKELISQGANGEDAVMISGLEHTNWNRIGLPEGPMEVLKQFNKSADQAASVFVKDVEGHNELIDRAVELAGNAEVTQGIRDQLANVMTDIGPMILLDRGMTAGLSIRMANAAANNDHAAVKALLPTMQQANVFRMALQRSAARAVSSGNIRVLSEEFPQLRKILETVLTPEEMPKPKAVPSDVPAVAASKSGALLHPSIEQSQSFVNQSKKVLDEAKAAAAKNPTPSNKSMWDMADKIYNDTKRRHDTFVELDKVVDAQIQFVIASQKAGVPDGLSRLYAAVNRIGVAPAIELWQSSILSGMPTFVVNTTSNMANSMLLRPGSRVVGGAMEAALGGGTEGLEQGVRHWGNLFEAVKDSISWQSMAMQNVWSGIKAESSMLAGHQQADFAHSISGATGRVVRSFGTAMNAVDEYFKNINYRAAVRTEAQNYANLSGESADDVAKRFLGRAYEDGKAAVDPETGEHVFQSGLREAFGSTFTDTLMDGTLAKWVQEGAQKHPGLKFVVPFVRTPANIMSKGLDYAPGLNLIRPTNGGEKFRMALKSADPMVRNQAQGELALSVLIGTGVATAFYNGNITGSGPGEAKTREAWLKVNKPYSIGVGKYQFQYNRLEPIATPMGILADILEAIPNSPDQATADSLGMKAVLLIRNNLTNKTFMQGVTQATNLASSNPMDLQQGLNSFAGSLVPKMVSQFADLDGTAREAKGVVENIQKNVPGWRDGLPPSRDMFGDVVETPRGLVPWTLGRSSVGDVMSPFQFSERIPSEVKSHLVDMGVVFQPPGRSLPSGLDLLQFVDKKGQSACDYWREHVGDILLPMDGKKMMLEEALQTLIQSPEYKKVAPPKTPGDRYNIRVKLLDALYESYKQAALYATAQHFEKDQGINLLKGEEMVKASRSGIDVSPYLQSDTTAERLQLLK